MTTLTVDASPTDAGGDARAPSDPDHPALVRPRECLISGTAAGLAAHLGRPVWMVRALFLLAAPILGAGVLFYLWLWMFVPWAPGETAASRKAPVAWVLVVVSAGLLVVGWAQIEWWRPWPFDARLWLLIVASALAAGLWASLVDRSDPARGPRHATVVQIVVTAILAVVFLFEFGRDRYESLDILRPFVPLASIALVWLAPLITRFRELTGERIARIREEQRAQMAAHLHDSVLQTLALIQNRAGASSEVARLARAQERELRAWLYDGDAPADSDLPTDLRDYGGALELDYPVRIDVVSAGLSTERASGEVAAAAREAMLNAARHAGGEVSVYIEGSATGVDVYVRDRGQGFDLDEVTSDRLGVRESIIGRMRRIGGTATVRSDEAGTEVHLRYRGTGHLEGGERRG